MRFEQLQGNPIIGHLRQVLAIFGLALVAYLIYDSRSTLESAVTNSPGMVALGLGFGSLSLLLQVSGFRVFPPISGVRWINLADIWCSAVIFNHIFPLAGGLGYRFVALRSKGIPIKQTGQGTLWFLGSSAAMSTSALIAITAFRRLPVIAALAISLAILGVGLIASRHLLQTGHRFVFGMLGYHGAQIFGMAIVVLTGANLADLSLSFTQAAVLGCVMRLGSLISLTPAGLGIQEAIIIGVLGAYGVTSDNSEATAVMVRLIYLVAAIVMAALSRVIGRNLPVTTEVSLPG